MVFNLFRRCFLYTINHRNNTKLTKIDRIHFASFPYVKITFIIDIITENGNTKINIVDAEMNFFIAFSLKSKN